MRYEGCHPIAKWMWKLSGSGSDPNAPGISGIRPDAGIGILGQETRHRGEPGEVVLRKLRKRDGPSVGLKIGSFSASYSEQATHEPRLACRIFLCYQPDPALSNHVDRLDTL